MWLGSCVAVALCRPGDATLVLPIAWELPNAAYVALKAKKKKKKKKKKHRQPIRLDLTVREQEAAETGQAAGRQHARAEGGRGVCPLAAGKKLGGQNKTG